jgi:G3E family GTPase
METLSGAAQAGFYEAKMKTPLVLLTGFLGSGKTTLIRRLMPQLTARKVRCHVLINDFGNAIFDAETLRAEAAAVEEITGSCVCCESLDALLDAISRTRPEGDAVILLETNGATDVPSLLEVLAMSRSTRHCTPPIQVAVVDADQWQRRGWNDSIELEQVASASYIQIAWQDACTAERLSDVRRRLRDVNPRHREIAVEDLARRLALLAISSQLEFSPPTTSPVLFKEAHHVHHDHQHGRYHFSAVELPLSPTVDREALLHCLEELPEEVLRAKGMVCLHDDPDSMFLAQKAGPTCAPSLLRFPRSKRPASMLVFIGPALDEESLRRHVQPLVA